MSMTYAQYVGRLTDAIGVLHNDVHLPILIPATIDYAEQRLYRALDLLTTVTQDGTGSFTANNRNFTFPQHFVVVQNINAISPASTAPDSGTRNPLVPTTKEVLDTLYPSSTGATLPIFFAMMTDQTIIVGPWPDTTYRVEVIGTVRPTPLSSSNTTSYLTLYLPDLFMAASLVFAAEWMGNFGSKPDGAAMSAEWEKETVSLLASANVEELRKKWTLGSWSAQAPVPMGAPGSPGGGAM